jgi:hypothetical protein
MSGPTAGMGYGLMGFGPMGFDDVTPVTPITPIASQMPALPPLPAARFWDATTKGFIQNADGTFQGVHPVDQMVQMLLTIEQGTVPALGKVGQRYRQRLQGVPANKALNVVKDETNVALAPLLQAGDITILSVTYFNKIVTVNYVNNRLPKNSSTQSTKSSPVSVYV